ncbi:MAG: hypothetical protein KAG12_01940, partial [Desulfuromusa sp.]|nr:hypothetical protein [Desulfuromusa sp.]
VLEHHDSCNFFSLEGKSPFTGVMCGSLPLQSTLYSLLILNDQQLRKFSKFENLTPAVIIILDYP